MFCALEERGLWGKGLRATGPYPLPHTPSPNPLYCLATKEMGMAAAPTSLAAMCSPGEGLSPRPSLQAPVALGMDFGSRYVKMVYQKEKGWGRKKLDSLTFFRDYLQRQAGRLTVDWERLGLPPPGALVVTGYGKNLLKEHFPTITEIRAHFLGACRTTNLTHFILLEVGGQDTKVLYVKGARVFDFLTNDRCAAGTGRYLENMARFLKMPLPEFAAAWQEPAEISHTCAIFGESELIGLLLEGTPPVCIAAGVNASVARRALLLVRRYPCRDLVFVGGVARNQGVVQTLRQQGDYRVIVPSFPQFNGALGCCLEARRLLPREEP